MAAERSEGEARSGVSGSGRSEAGMTAAGLRAVGYSLGSAGAAALTIAGVLHTAVGLLGIAGLGFAGVLSLLCGFGFARDAWLKDRKAATTRRLMASGLFGTATVTGLEQASYWS